MSPGAAGHTIGVALRIPDPYAAVLDEARERFEPEAGDMPAHVTILAPIDVDADALPAVDRHLTSVAAATSPFRLVLQGAGTFRPVSPVVFVGVGLGAADCELLEKQVRSGDMAVETRFPYHPHVTVAHDVDATVLDAALEELAGFEAAFDVASMGLYENVNGSWMLIREFDFTG